MHPFGEHRAEERAKAHRVIHRAGYARGGGVKGEERIATEAVHEHERDMHHAKKLTDIKYHEDGEKGRKHLAKRARGGRMGKKGATHVNVIVAPQGGGMGGGMRPPGSLPIAQAAPPAPHPMPGVGGPPMGGAPGGMMPARPMGPPMGGMPRKRGGRVPMEAGAGGGEGRIEKMHEYGTGRGFKPKEKPLHA